MMPPPVVASVPAFVIMIEPLLAPEPATEIAPVIPLLVVVPESMVKAVPLCEFREIVPPSPSVPLLAADIAPAIVSVPGLLLVPAVKVMLAPAPSPIPLPVALLMMPLLLPV